MLGVRRYGSFPMQPDGAGHFTIDPVIAGKPEHMLVDTGGVYSSLLASTAKDLNLTVSDSLRERDVDINGHKSNSVTSAPIVLLGFARFRDVKMIVNADDDPLFAGANVQGILAPDILSAMDIDLDFGNGVMSLLDENHCENATPYWSQTWASTPFRYDRDGHIAIAVNLDGKPIPAIIDTGSPATAMSLPEARSVFGLEPDSPGVKPLGTLHKINNPNQKTYTYTFGSLKMGTIEFKNPEIALLPDNMSNQNQSGLPDLIIGLRDLSKLHLYIAFKTRMLYFTSADSRYRMVEVPVQIAPGSKDPMAGATAPQAH